MNSHILKDWQDRRKAPETAECHDVNQPILSRVAQRKSTCTENRRSRVRLPPCAPVLPLLESLLYIVIDTKAMRIYFIGKKAVFYGRNI